LKVFLENYSLPTLIISAVVSAITLVYDKFLAQKMPTWIRNFIPFILAIIFYFAYDMLFVLKSFSFSLGTFSAGFLSGSLSIVITASIYKLKSGKPINVNAIAVLIESLISDYVSDDAIFSSVNVIQDILDSDVASAEEQIEEILACNSVNKTELELKAISALIVKAVSAVKQK
jgi:hypothetical protein